MVFDLYFAGQHGDVTRDYLLELGCNRLHSQLNEKKDIKQWAELSHPPSKLFIDSGAYSAHTIGREINIKEYTEYLNEISPTINLCAQVDKIPGQFRQPKTPQQLLEAPKLSWNNYRLMHDLLKEPDKLLYIFHQGEDFRWLKKCLNTKMHGKYIPYMGISPANDRSTKEKKDWFETVFQIIRDSNNPNIKTHAFGMTSLKALEIYPFTSADSTGWIMTGANGGIMTKYGTRVVSNKQKHLKEHISHGLEEARIKLYKEIEDLGFSVEALGADYNERIKYNILYLKTWADSYKYKGNNVYTTKLFQQGEPQMVREDKELSEVTLLGNQNTKYLTEYTPSILETFENKHQDNNYLVTFTAPEFTSLCPKTGQPDFASITINYIPAVKMVESKSLKLYMFSFRNNGDFHEDCVNMIMKDLVALMEPKYLEVHGRFMPRGGIAIHPFCNYSRDDEFEQFKNSRCLTVLGNTF